MWYGIYRSRSSRWKSNDLGRLISSVSSRHWFHRMLGFLELSTDFRNAFRRWIIVHTKKEKKSWQPNCIRVCNFYHVEKLGQLERQLGKNHQNYRVMGVKLAKTLECYCDELTPHRLEFILVSSIVTSTDHLNSSVAVHFLLYLHIHGFSMFQVCGKLV